MWIKSKLFFWLIGFLLILLTACGSSTQPVITLNSTPYPEPTQTREKITPSPTSPRVILTPKPSSAPFPTLTPYPTFEIQNLKTAIPFQPSQCPSENPNYRFTGVSSEDLGALIFLTQRELEAGATFAQAKYELENFHGYEFAEIMDLTGDGVSELIVHQMRTFLVIGCDNNGYKTLLEYNPDIGGSGSPSIFTVLDMNLNGIPDVVLTYSALTGGNTGVDILEWNGISFNSQIKFYHGENSINTSGLARGLFWYGTASNLPVMNGHASVIVQDLDSNGTRELILIDEGPTNPDTLLNFGPWRGQQRIFEWDGMHYLYVSLELDEPVYRFQAVQDADRFFLLGNYDRALELYQEVISNPSLDWWSLEKMAFNETSFTEQAMGTPTSVPPLPDMNEYTSLVSYAKYRILLHQLTLELDSEALKTYQVIATEFSEGNVSDEFAMMVTILWEDYQRSKDIEHSCQQVIAYVQSHPEILTVLGSEYGLQSHTYLPEDVCPVP